MPRPYILSVLRTKVAEDARHRCGYCLTSQLITAMPLHVEHIIPLAVGGNSDEANLWLACPLCNGFKGSQTHHPDPETGEAAPLFNPRWQSWSEHFQWSAGGSWLAGIRPRPKRKQPPNTKRAACKPYIPMGKLLPIAYALLCKDAEHCGVSQQMQQTIRRQSTTPPHNKPA